MLFFVLLLEVSTCAWGFWLFLWLGFLFCLFLGLDVVVVVGVVSTTFGVELFCLVVVVTCFRVHNTFEGVAGLAVFLVRFVRWVAGWLCWLPQVEYAIGLHHAETTAARFFVYTALFILQIDMNSEN